MSSLKALTVALCLAALAAPGTALAAPPANDDFADATVLTGRESFPEGSNVDATEELGEPNHAGDPGGTSIWYRWSAPADGRTTISTCWSEFDTLLGVYTGSSVSTLVAVASNDDACGAGSRVTFEADQGVVYHIAVDGKAGASGYVFLALGLSPPNDDFADAQPLAGDVGSVTGTTLGASLETGEPVYGSNSVWFKWTAPTTGWATFQTCGSGFDTILAVFTGSALNALSYVTDDDDGCGTASRVYFHATEGLAYSVALAGYGGGQYTLEWNRNPPPPLLVDDPRVQGIARDGETLTATEGVWAGQGPFQYAYAWGRCDRDWENCDLIGGATSNTFTVRSVDVGYRLWVRVTATNATGSSEAYSSTTALVAARPPSNVSRPFVEGEARLNAILVAGPGTWVGTAPISFTYQWQECDLAVTSCLDLPGQTGQIMRVSSIAPDLFRVVVTATNVAGSASTASLAIDVERPVATARCVVPNVRGKTLRSAKAAIRRNRCKVGRVRRQFSARVRLGRVVSQTPRAGRRLAAGAKVHLVVSKGRRR